MSKSATSSANGASRIHTLWIEYGAALWALVFVLLHVAWAFGWYIGLDAGEARKAFERGWFLAYDLIAAGLCLLAVAVALALVRSWGRKMSRRLLVAAVWSCAVILLLRGGAGAVNAVYLAIVGGSFTPLFSFWDWWFCLGALFFAASAWRFSRRAARISATNG